MGLVMLRFVSVFALARASEWTVIQAGQLFLDAKAGAKVDQIRSTPSAGRDMTLTKLKVKVGDQVVFKNEDKVTHNVYGEGFDLLAQPPGTERRQTFTKPGEQTIRCAIHPKMKFVLEVAP